MTLRHQAEVNQVDQAQQAFQHGDGGMGNQVMQQIPRSSAPRPWYPERARPGILPRARGRVIAGAAELLAHMAVQIEGAGIVQGNPASRNDGGRAGRMQNDVAPGAIFDPIAERLHHLRTAGQLLRLHQDVQIVQEARRAGSG